MWFRDVFGKYWGFPSAGGMCLVIVSVFLVIWVLSGDFVDCRWGFCRPNLNSCSAPVWGECGGLSRWLGVQVLPNGIAC